MKRSCPWSGTATYCPLGGPTRISGREGVIDLDCIKVLTLKVPKYLGTHEDIEKMG